MKYVFPFAMTAILITTTRTQANQTDLFFPIYPEGSSPPVITDLPNNESTGSSLTWTNTLNDTLEGAYERAQGNGFLSDTTIDETKAYSPLTRVQLAKLMLNFSYLLPHKSSGENYTCDIVSYQDNKIIEEGDLSIVQQICTLGIMWRKPGKVSLIEFFNPYGKVSRAELATVLSRFLYGILYDKDSSEQETRYSEHLLHLHEEWFIHKIDDPFMTELQWYVLLILQRIAAREGFL